MNHRLETKLSLLNINHTLLGDVAAFIIYGFYSDKYLTFPMHVNLLITAKMLLLARSFAYSNLIDKGKIPEA